MQERSKKEPWQCYVCLQLNFKLNIHHCPGCGAYQMNDPPAPLKQGTERKAEETTSVDDFYGSEDTDVKAELNYDDDFDTTDDIDEALSELGMLSESIVLEDDRTAHQNSKKKNHDSTQFKVMQSAFKAMSKRNPRSSSSSMERSSRPSSVQQPTRRKPGKHRQSNNDKPDLNIASEFAELSLGDEESGAVLQRFGDHNQDTLVWDQSSDDDTPLEHRPPTEERAQFTMADFLSNSPHLDTPAKIEDSYQDDDVAMNTAIEASLYASYAEQNNTMENDHDFDDYPDPGQMAPSSRDQSRLRQSSSSNSRRNRYEHDQLNRSDRTDSPGDFLHGPDRHAHVPTGHASHAKRTDGDRAHDEYDQTFPSISSSQRPSTSSGRCQEPTKLAWSSKVKTDYQDPSGQSLPGRVSKSHGRKKRQQRRSGDSPIRNGVRVDTDLERALKLSQQSFEEEQPRMRQHPSGLDVNSVSANKQDRQSQNSNNDLKEIPCPVCNECFCKSDIQEHVEDCLASSVW